ncbi:hypothetical protein BH10PAT1_BH10PAT1_7900 [soil metagenome]
MEYDYNNGYQYRLRQFQELTIEGWMRTVPFWDEETRKGVIKIRNTSKEERETEAWVLYEKAVAEMDDYERLNLFGQSILRNLSNEQLDLAISIFPPQE